MVNNIQGVFVPQVFDQALNPLRVQFVAEDPEPEKFLKISCLFRFGIFLDVQMYACTSKAVELAV